jgi:group I intron endonuclease
MMQNNNNSELTYLTTYLNIDRDKFIIYKENRRKSGIYRLNNLITGMSYIGSAINLARRMSTYFSLGSLNKELLKGNSKIYNGLLKYGYKNFSLDILEYCERDVLIKREQYYIDKLKPEYNILKIAGNRLGFKHSEATKDKMRGINNHFFGKTHTSETRKMIGLSLRSIIRTNNKPKVLKLETKLKLSLRSHGVSVKVFDKSNNLIQQFPTMTSAAKYYGIHRRTIGSYLDKDRFYNEYAFKSNFKDNRI